VDILACRKDDPQITSSLQAETYPGALEDHLHQPVTEKQQDSNSHAIFFPLQRGRSVIAYHCWVLQYPSVQGPSDVSFDRFEVLAKENLKHFVMVLL
jgi:hypothetical protein